MASSTAIDDARAYLYGGSTCVGYPTAEEAGSPRTLAHLDALITALGEPTTPELVHLHDDLVFHLLMCHPWVKSNRQGKAFRPSAPGRPHYLVQWVNTSVKPAAMTKYVKAKAKKGGDPVPKAYKFPNDDAVYSCEYDEYGATLAAYLRAYQSRGFTYFKFLVGGEELAQQPAFAAMDRLETRLDDAIDIGDVDANTIDSRYTTVVRGLNKFTGLTATDEDDVSDASSLKRLFFAGGRSHLDADSLFVTTKSNGENAKATLRSIAGEWWVLAGSKNVCLAAPLDSDPRTLYSQADPTIPSWKILNAFHDYVSGPLTAAGQVDELGTLLDDNAYVILFEFNNATHEHLFPIPEDFLDGFAIRGAGAAAIDPLRTFEIFNTYAFPAVKCEHRPTDDLDAVVAEVRADTTTEGVVIYFMLDGAVIGLLKVKSDFYTLARATREQFKRLGNTVVSGLKKATNPVSVLDITPATIEDVEHRIRRRMARMTQIPNYETHHAAWAARAIAFCHWWLDNYYNTAPLTVAARKAAIHHSRAKFGSLYAEFSAQYLPPADLGPDAADAAAPSSQ